MDSDVFLSPRYTRPDPTEDSEKRGDGNSGMWFGPRLGRSLQRHSSLDYNRLNPIESMI